MLFFYFLVWSRKGPFYIATKKSIRNLNSGREKIRHFFYFLGWPRKGSFYSAIEFFFEIQVLEGGNYGFCLISWGGCERWLYFATRESLRNPDSRKGKLFFCVFLRSPRQKPFYVATKRSVRNPGSGRKKLQHLFVFVLVGPAWNHFVKGTWKFSCVHESFHVRRERFLDEVGLDRVQAVGHIPQMLLRCTRKWPLYIATKKNCEFQVLDRGNYSLFWFLGGNSERGHFTLPYDFFLHSQEKVLEIQVLEGGNHVFFLLGPENQLVVPKEAERGHFTLPQEQVLEI